MRSVCPIEAGNVIASAGVIEVAWQALSSRSDCQNKTPSTPSFKQKKIIKKTIGSDSLKA